MRSVIALSVLVAVSLAGCSGGEDAAPERDDGGGQVDPVATARAPPTWQIGTWWRYDRTGDEPGQETRAVTGQTGDAWIVDTTDSGTALFDARTDISVLGPQYKADLAASQHGQKVLLFQWPLEDGASWTTTWDQVERAITAHAPGVGGGPTEKWTFEAFEDDVRRVTYTYDPAVAWFTEMVFYDNNGTEVFGMRLRDHGTDFQGTPVRAVIGQSVRQDGNAGTATMELAEDERVWARVRITCGDGAAYFEAAPVGGGEGIQVVGQPGCTVDETHDIEGTPGTWRVSNGASAMPPRLDAEVLAYTVIPVTVGEG